MKYYRLIVCAIFCLSGCTSNIKKIEDSSAATPHGAMQFSEISKSFKTPEYVWSANGASDHPTPPQLIYSVAPEFPRLMLERNIEGRALVMFIVEKDGSTSHVTAIEATNRLFAESAEEAVRNWKYAPGYYEGEPVAIRSRIEIPFMIREPNKSLEVTPLADARVAPQL